MKVPLDEALLCHFEKVLDTPPPSGKQKEQVIQDFLECNTELIPTPNLLNHHLHFEAVVSKFPLGTELTTDLLYITKSSDLWRITLVELELPDKKVFIGDTTRARTSAAFNAALDQVRSWKVFVDRNRDEIIRRLEPLLQPLSMYRNPKEFQYILVIGRSGNKNLSPQRQSHFREVIRGTDIDILTYDTLINWYRYGDRYKKNVMRLTGAQFEFKYMHLDPQHMLSYMGPDSLLLSPAQRTRLIESGYEIGEWQKGHLLSVNGRQTIQCFGRGLDG